MIKHAYKIATAVFFAFVSISTGNAQTIPAPTGPVILRVTGNDAGAVADISFDRSTLKSLGLVSFQTTTIWTQGIQSFEGVPLKSLIDALDITTGTLLATAINDYTVEIPVTDAVEGGPILAFSLNGEDMSIRDKGPLWIVYPYDDDPDYRTEVIYSRSIWQLDRIHVVE